MRPSSRVLLGTALAVLVTVAATSVALELGESRPAHARPTAAASSEPSAAQASPRDHTVRRIVIGRSISGRVILAREAGNAARRRTILVVGCIHGNEPAGIAVARDLVSDPVPRHLNLWVVADLNPDGRAVDTRQNARGVDLNRNFPWRWRPLDSTGGTFYSGPRPLSEPESRAADAFILRIRPGITLWFHQHANLVDESGGRVAVERRYARLVRLPLRRLPRFPGSAAGWENHRVRGGTAFVVELPSGHLSPTQVERFSDAILKLR